MEILRLSDFGKDLTKKHKRDKINQDASSVANLFRVTDIKPAVKNQNRVNIFINDKYSFSLDIAQLVDFKLKVGKTLSSEQLEEYRKASEFGKLYQRTLEWVLTRPHSIKETRDYLYRSIKRREQKARLKELEQKRLVKKQGRKLTPPKNQASQPSLIELLSGMTEEIIARLIAKNYLNDETFTEYYIENRFVKKGISRRRLEQELIKKGVNRQIIEQALANSNRNETAELKKIIEKKRRKYDDEKLINYLVRQGFDYCSAKTAVQDFDETD